MVDETEQPAEAVPRLVAGLRGSYAALCVGLPAFAALYLTLSPGTRELLGSRRVRAYNS